MRSSVLKTFDQSPLLRGGHSLGAAETVEEAIQLAKLDWRVQEAPVYFQGSDGSFQRDDGFKRLVRGDTGKRLHIVKSSYEVFQNEEVFSTLASLLEDGEVRLASAGEWNGGQRVFVCLEILGKRLEVVPGDPLERFLLSANGHTGGLSLMFRYMAHMLACWNAFPAVLQRNSSMRLHVRHTSNMRHRVKEVRQVLAGHRKAFERTIEFGQALARHRMTERQFSDFAWELVAPGTTPEERTDGQQAKVIDLVRTFRSAPGQEIEGRRGTAWGAFNAITHSTSHNERTRQNPVRYSAFDTGAQTTRRAARMLADQFQVRLAA